MAIKQANSIRFSFFWALVFALLVYSQKAIFATALDDYVSMPDSNYSWSFDRSESVGILPPSYTTYFLDMTSQQWRSETDSDRPIWTHKLTITRPRFSGAAATALIVVGGGDNDDVNGITEPDTIADEGALAWATGSAICHMTTVPNQPILFSDEISPRSEDAILAYTWDKYLNGGDPNWIAHLPMVKAIVRAMDTVQAYLQNPATGSAVTINQFVLTGGSKRGWACWLAAAVDSRVVAVAPVVTDLLKLEKVFSHHWGAYGSWSAAIQDYVDAGVLDWTDTPQMESLLDIVDPIRYLDRYATLEKFMNFSTGDEFFVLDSNHFYLDRLLNETTNTFIRHVPNDNHAFDNDFSEVFNRMAPHWDDFLKGIPKPQFSWQFEADGTINVQTIDAPVAVRLWQAHNPEARDFRLETLGPVWTDTILTDQGSGVYVGQVADPNTGWTAFFVEMEYLSNNIFFDPPQNYKLTTQVRVLPETLPFAADFDRSGVVDPADLVRFSPYWLTDDCVRDLSPLYGDDMVNFHDFGAIEGSWLGP
jgi:PhoPQ-activated pathogenicity-related protein